MNRLSVSTSACWLFHGWRCGVAFPQGGKQRCRISFFSSFPPFFSSCVVRKFSRFRIPGLPNNTFLWSGAAATWRDELVLHWFRAVSQGRLGPDEEEEEKAIDNWKGRERELFFLFFQTFLSVVLSSVCLFPSQIAFGTSYMRTALNVDKCAAPTGTIWRRSVSAVFFLFFSVASNAVCTIFPAVVVCRCTSTRFYSLTLCT